MKKAILYINQFFAGIGGEEKADYEPEIREGLVGPGLALKAALKEAEITHTIVCGDNFMGSNEEEAVSRILTFLEDKEFDIFYAGPAFQAGRYGNACGVICKAVKAKFGVEAISSMHEENPGVDMFKKDLYIFPGGKSAAAMRKDVAKMAKLGDQILTGKKDLLQEEVGFFPRSIRLQVWRDDQKTAADRAVDMLLSKLSDEPFETELVIPKPDRVPIAKPITDLKKANIALVTSGGIVPVGNPDRIQSSSATRWGRYDISEIDRLESGLYKTIHSGYDPTAADADPNVVMPLDVMKVYEKEGKFGSLHPYFYATVGMGTAEAEAARIANEMIPYLQDANVDGILLVST